MTSSVKQRIKQAKPKRLFITATDTDAGKTFFASALIKKLVNEGNKVAAYKPVSAGCDLIEGQLVNEDASLLLSASNCRQTLENVNPIAFEEPIAPHIAANKYQQEITLEGLVKGFNSLPIEDADIVITEGAGGWRLPLGNGTFLSELPKQETMDVIVVVNMKLGCLNHALLTVQAIEQDGLNVAAWVANCQEQMPFVDENIETLKQHISAPLMAVIPPACDSEKAQALIDLSVLSL